MFMTGDLLQSEQIQFSNFREGVLHLDVNFTSGEKRSTWETTFLDAKQKLCKLVQLNE